MPTTTSKNVLDILQKHLDTATTGCVVGKWIDTLGDDEKAAFELVREKNTLVSLTGMFKDLSHSQSLPFGMTSFRGHFRGSCGCPKTY